MPSEIELKEKYERNGWPAQKRPDSKPPDGWSLPLVTSIDRPRNHTLAPDGEAVAFFWDRADASDLYVMPATGGWPARLSADRAPVAYWSDDQPQWSPDGQWLAYTAGDHVYVVAPSGSLPKKITDFTTDASSPRWMPDGAGLLIAHSRNEESRIMLTDREGAWPRLLTQGPGHDLDPQASPDGHHVVYVRQPLDDLNRSDIMRVNIETGQIDHLTGIEGLHDWAPRWSPDGSQIAFLSERTGHHELFTMQANGGRLRQVTSYNLDLADIAWSPDGRRIACTVNRQGALDLGVVEVESGRLTDLRTGLGCHALPQWSPDGLWLTFEYEGWNSPADLYRIEVETRNVTQLTFSKPPGLAVLDLVQPERITYKSFDRLEIPAFLYRPPKPNGAGIVYPHGGPTSQYLFEFDIWMQYLAAKGYTVLAPNFRGSTGYGIEFERANHNVWGVDDTQDCLHAADYLVAEMGLDRERLAIYGASYGSYMAVCCLAYDPEYRYACGIAKFGDCNILSSWAQGDQSGREDLERQMQHPAKNQAGYRAGSPVWQVKNIQRPLFIAHGLEDRRVHPLQSEELVEALSREGKIFEYKTYAGEGHGFLRRKTQLDFFERVERFIDWYLL